MPRGKMPMSERAKIFIPFDPLKGFTEALRAKELEVELAMTEGDGVTRTEGWRPIEETGE